MGSARKEIIPQTVRTTTPPRTSQRFFRAKSTSPRINGKSQACKARIKTAGELGKAGRHARGMAGMTLKTTERCRVCHVTESRTACPQQKWRASRVQCSPFFGRPDLRRHGEGESGVTARP